MTSGTLEGPTDWDRVSDVIAHALGLHFPPQRLIDLQRGLAGAAAELGFDGAAGCAGRLLSERLTRAELHVVASHLTIGETYFFREPKTLEVLARTILPELIRQRRGREQRLRFWSAGCCSGEEAYSLAILLKQALPDLSSWHVSILATDVNPRFLLKAAAGTYGEWSFRGAPVGFKDQYFTNPKAGRYVIRPEIRSLVSFEHLNLVEDVYPSLATDTNAMDVIFCRNVLMYFTPSQFRNVVDKFHRSVIDGGWLVVSPSEASQALFPQFVTRNFPGAILFERSDEAVRRGRTRGLAEEALGPAPGTAARPAPPAWMPPPSPLAHPTRRQDESAAQPSALALAAALYERGEYEEAADALVASFSLHRPAPQAFSLLARALANQGRLADALEWCDKWIEADKSNAAGHYMRAVILLEQGLHEQARASLVRAVYLQPSFVLAHFTLGTLARSLGQHESAARHFAVSLRLLAGLEPHELLPESEGLTAGRLTETIAIMAPPDQAR